jgi:hypothetical protein
VVDDHTAAWQALFADFDPTKTVILEEGQAGSLSETGDRGLEIEGGTIQFVRYQSNEIVLAIEMPADGWLVLSQVYYPGWQATVDGERTKVLRADYTFRAVALAQGEHIVRMKFVPWSWRAGLAVSAVTWVGLIAWTVWKLGKHLRKKQQPANLPPRQPMV